MNPYNHNPFTTTEPRDLHSEADANRELAKTVNARFRKELDSKDVYTADFHKGILVGVAELANDLRVVLDNDNLREWLDN
jgi:hypothetical protein